MALKCKPLEQFVIDWNKKIIVYNYITFGLNTPLHALGEHNGMHNYEELQTNVKSQGFIYRFLFPQVTLINPYGAKCVSINLNMSATPV